MHWLLLLNKMMWEARYVAKSVLPASAAAGGNTEVHKCVISCGPFMSEDYGKHLFASLWVFSLPQDCRDLKYRTRDKYHEISVTIPRLNNHQ